MVTRSLNTSVHYDIFDCMELHAAWNKIDDMEHVNVNAECRYIAYVPSRREGTCAIRTAILSLLASFLSSLCQPPCMYTVKLSSLHIT